MQWGLRLLQGIKGTIGFSLGLHEGERDQHMKGGRSELGYKVVCGEATWNEVLISLLEPDQ